MNVIINYSPATYFVMSCLLTNGRYLTLHSRWIHRVVYFSVCFPKYKVHTVWFVLFGCTIVYMFSICDHGPKIKDRKVTVLYSSWYILELSCYLHSTYYVDIFYHYTCIDQYDNTRRHQYIMHESSDTFDVLSSKQLWVWIDNQYRFVVSDRCSIYSNSAPGKGRELYRSIGSYNVGMIR